MRTTLQKREINEEDASLLMKMTLPINDDLNDDQNHDISDSSVEARERD